MSRTAWIKTGMVMFLVLLVLGICLHLNGLEESSQSPKQKPVQEKKEKVVIGVTLASDSTDYQEDLGNFIKEYAEADEECILDLEYAQWDVNTQKEQIGDFIEEGVDAIVLCPVDAKSLLNVLKEASQKGIPVVNLNMKVDTVSSKYVTTYVGASMAEEADLAANLVVEYLDGRKGKVGIIEGAMGSDPQIYRTQIFLEHLTAFPNVEVVGIVDGKWSRSHSVLAAWDLLHKYPDLDIIYCHDSNMALGAYETLVSQGREDDIKIIGIGNAQEYMDALKEGKLYGIITQPPDYEAHYAMVCAKKAARGQALRAWYKNPVEVLTIENVDRYKSPMESKNIY